MHSPGLVDILPVPWAGLWVRFHPQATGVAWKRKREIFLSLLFFTYFHVFYCFFHIRWRYDFSLNIGHNSEEKWHTLVASPPNGSEAMFSEITFHWLLFVLRIKVPEIAAMQNIAMYIKVGPMEIDMKRAKYANIDGVLLLKISIF